MSTNTDPATVALYDAQVRAAWTNHALSDGTKLNVGKIDQEQMFAVTPTGTYAVVATHAGWQQSMMEARGEPPSPTQRQYSLMPEAIRTRLGATVIF